MQVKAHPLQLVPGDRMMMHRLTNPEVWTVESVTGQRGRYYVRFRTPDGEVAHHTFTLNTGGKHLRVF